MTNDLENNAIIKSLISILIWGDREDIPLRVEGGILLHFRGKVHDDYDPSDLIKDYYGENAYCGVAKLIELTHNSYVICLGDESGHIDILGIMDEEVYERIYDRLSKLYLDIKKKFPTSDSKNSDRDSQNVNS